MTPTRDLRLEWTTGSAIVSLGLLLVTAVLCWTAWRRSGYRASIGLLEAARLSLVGLAALLLNQPEWVEEFRPEEQPTIAVLWDGSPSMDTRDATPIDADAPATRKERIAPWLDPNMWKPLDDRLRVAIEPFAAEADPPASDLHEPLDRVRERHKGLRGVVLLSDGDWNDGPPPVEAAVRLRQRGVPVFVVPVGSRSRLPDLELLSLDAPTFGVAGKPVRIPFTIESSLPRDTLASVVLRDSSGGEVVKEITIHAMGRTSDAIVWTSPAQGDYVLSLSVPRHADEAIAGNNELAAPIAVRDEKLRVLVVESQPRWEYRYLRNALSRDPGVDVACLLFHPGLNKAGGGNADYIARFPESLDALSVFDVVFLGDVGVEPNQLTAEQCRLVRGLVEHQASGLVLMPGILGKQMTLLDTELGDVYPVVLDPAQPSGWGARTPGHFELTEFGQRSLLTKLADTQDDNMDIWQSLPGFQWYAPVIRAKAGSDVLCVHKDAVNEFGRLPLLVTRTLGAGKVLFMGTDGAWRWRKGVEDKYHYRFWGQVVRWMAYSRNMAKGETMRLYYSPDQPRLRQNVTLRVNAMEPGGEPLAKGDITARVTAPSGKVDTIRFRADGDEWGSYVAAFLTREPGKHDLRLNCGQTGATLDASFFVQGTASERAGRPARPEVLEEIARVTEGAVLDAAETDGVLRRLASLPDPPSTIRRLPLWSHPATAALFVGFLCAFWVGRKAAGLI
ncbi:MAG: hypothetical protein FJ297_06300 [Planctomycetes bacterium]|nr:hypothetical protein [Planctomycetota bacterium]